MRLVILHYGDIKPFVLEEMKWFLPQKKKEKDLFPYNASKIDIDIYSF